ncbi:Internalin-A precursor [Enhygromyxa salina]|uniref:Internalin-A n=1 Tax=Enhygromyxa salina TaxID=215803 RepID=A0A2S9Y670_9BACT|nr:hypothetical protein [Enhygromyxa salina]PRQ00609.1 Internalin-A precursor [Enhygromyxa salina]
MPDALLRALELGGWPSVPDDDHAELRALIERARSGQLSEPSGASISLASASISGSLRPRQAERSSSAMAAAAVLEPAHDAEQLSPEQARAWVFADALQARGDGRGELLALELAAEHTDDPAHARLLQREHRACWRSFAAPLRASRSLRLRWVGGFLLGAHPQDQHELHRLLASPAAAELERVRVDFCTQEELERLVGAARAHARPLAVIELPNSRLSGLGPLTTLDSLRLLRVGDRFNPAVLARLRGLRGLALLGADQAGAEALAAAPALELLDLTRVDLGRLDGLAARLPSLRRLSLERVDLDRGLGCLAGAEQLETLRLPESPLRELGPLPELPRLRELLVTPGNLRLVRELGALTKLERLALSGNNVGELDTLTKLEACEHLALRGARTTALSRLRHLPRLRSLSIVGGDMRRSSGLERLIELEQLSLAKLANLDLGALANFERLDTLVLAPGGRRPKQLETLATLPKLRRLSAPLELIASAPRPARVLANIEVLELGDAGVPPPSLLRQLPKLRRLLLPGRDPLELERVAKQHPELAVFGETAPRDLLERRDPFDWRNVGWAPHAGCSL